MQQIWILIMPGYYASSSKIVDKIWIYFSLKQKVKKIFSLKSLREKKRLWRNLSQRQLNWLLMLVKELYFTLGDHQEEENLVWVRIWKNSEEILSLSPNAEVYAPKMVMIQMKIMNLIETRNNLKMYIPTLLNQYCHFWASLLGNCPLEEIIVLL